MADITRRIKRDVDFSEFLKVLKRTEKPAYLPFYEHVASPRFIAQRTGTSFESLDVGDEGYWEIYVDFWAGMGFDCVRMEIPLNCPLAGDDGHQTSHGSEAHAVIGNRKDYDRYQWPDPATPIDFSHFDHVAALLPTGLKIVGGVCMGPYEWASQMMGVMGLSYALVDDPELVSLVFSRIGELHVSAVGTLADMDEVGAIAQGDDLGFKSATFLSPDLLRAHVFPIYRAMADEAHKRGKPFILHSCGNLTEVYDDLIDYCDIDAKHSYEDVIMPVQYFKHHYGSRVTPLGGLDVDVICRSDEATLRRYARRMIEECFEDGFWALGTGNSLTDYMPVANYLAVLEEGLNVR